MPIGPFARPTVLHPLSRQGLHMRAVSTSAMISAALCLLRAPWPWLFACSLSCQDRPSRLPVHPIPGAGLWAWPLSAFLVRPGLACCCGIGSASDLICVPWRILASGPGPPHSVSSRWRLTAGFPLAVAAILAGLSREFIATHQSIEVLFSSCFLRPEACARGSWLLLHGGMALHLWCDVPTPHAPGSYQPLAFWHMAPDSEQIRSPEESEVARFSEVSLIRVWLPAVLVARQHT